VNSTQTLLPNILQIMWLQYIPTLPDLHNYKLYHLNKLKNVNKTLIKRASNFPLEAQKHSEMKEAE
jgi:hypothetical protein